MSNPGEVIVHVGGTVNPALLAGLGTLDARLAAAGASSETAAIKAQQAAKTTNETLRNLRDAGNQGFEELSQKAGEFAAGLGGATGKLAEVGVKSLAAFGDVGMAITATIGIAALLTQAYREHEAELERHRVTTESVKAATMALGGAYASVAEAARAATTAEAARLAIAKEIAAITASQVAVVGEGFTLDQARTTVAAYHEVSEASRIAGTTVDRFTQAQVQHAISSGNMTEQMLILGVAIERSTIAEVEHQNVLQRVASSRSVAASSALQQAQAAYDATRRNEGGVRSATEQIRAEQAALVTLAAARTRATEATAEATRVEQASALAIINATEAATRAAQVADESRTLKAKQAEQAAARAGGPTAAERQQARNASQTGARGLVDAMEQDAIERRVAESEARLTAAGNARGAAAEATAAREHELAMQAIDVAAAQASMADQLADKERTRLNAQREAHESYTGRLRELYGEQQSAAQIAAEMTHAAFEGVGNAVAKNIELYAQGRITLKQLGEGILADSLEVIAKRMYAKGAEMLADAAGFAVMGNFVQAGGALAASAGFFATGAAISAAGAAVAPSPPSTGGGAGGAGGISRAPSAPISSESGPAVVNNYYAPTFGGREGTPAEAGEHMGRYTTAAARRQRDS